MPIGSVTLGDALDPEERAPTRHEVTHSFLSVNRAITPSFDGAAGGAVRSLGDRLALGAGCGVWG